MTPVEPCFDELSRRLHVLARHGTISIGLLSTCALVAFVASVALPAFVVGLASTGVAGLVCILLVLNDNIGIVHAAARAGQATGDQALHAFSRLARRGVTIILVAIVLGGVLLAAMVAVSWAFLVFVGDVYMILADLFILPIVLSWCVAAILASGTWIEAWRFAGTFFTGQPSWSRAACVMGVSRLVKGHKAVLVLATCTAACTILIPFTMWLGAFLTLLFGAPVISLVQFKGVRLVAAGFERASLAATPSAGEIHGFYNLVPIPVRSSPAVEPAVPVTRKSLSPPAARCKYCLGDLSVWAGTPVLTCPRCGAILASIP